MMYDSYKINTKILKRAITEINNSLDPVKEKSKHVPDLQSLKY